MNGPMQFDPAHPERGWHPAVPLPLFVGWRLRNCRCGCGEMFRGKQARGMYEKHWRAAHGPRPDSEDIPCSFCGARPGETCVGKDGKSTLPHTSREVRYAFRHVDALEARLQRGPDA